MTLKSIIYVLFISFLQLSLMHSASAVLNVAFRGATNQTFLYPNATHQAPRILRFGGPFEPFSAPLVLSTAPNTDKAGAIILAYTESGWSWDRIVRREFSLGAVSVICVSRGYTEFPGGTDFIYDGTDVTDLKIPVVEIIRREADVLLANLTAGVNLTATLTCCDANPWDEWNRSGWMMAYSVIVGGYSVFVFTFALLKFALLMRRAPAFNVGAVTLVIIIVGNLIRAITNTVDPILSRRTFPNPSQYVLLTLSWPFTTVATLVITFYWLELIKMQKKVQVNNFLQKLLWPFVIAGALLISVELASSISRGLDLAIDFLLYFTAALYVIIDGVVTALFWWTGAKVMKQLSDGAASTGTVDSKRSKRLKRATRLIMMSVAGNIIFILVLILGGFTSLLYHPVAYSVLWMLNFISLTFTDMCKVWALRVPKSANATTSVSSGPKSVGSHSESTNSSRV